MTLSCAEYFWPDLKRLLEHYIYITEGTKVDLDVNLSIYPPYMCLSIYLSTLLVGVYLSIYPTCT